jgi:hypothetical protein
MRRRSQGQRVRVGPLEINQEISQASISFGDDGLVTLGRR